MKRAMRKIMLFMLSVMTYCGVMAQESLEPEGKEIYIPNEFREDDFNNPESKWSYHRMATSENFVVFWEKGFGADLSKAPDLEGRNMKVDLDNLLKRLEEFYAVYRDKMKFVLPGSKSERYRMMVMLNYSLEGTAYGGSYDNVIGALWVSPNRIQDKKLNCIAHELGHSFQSQISCDGTGQSWGGGGIFEMTSQWMLWNVNPEWTTDENYHLQDFKKKFHLRFLHGSNIYHSPYVLEYWSMKRGLGVIADLFRAGRRGEDPASTYMKMFDLTVDQFSDEMYDCYSRLITFDFPRVKESHRKFAGEFSTPMDKESGVWTPAEGFAPEIYGFNVVEIPIEKKGAKIKLQFKGDSDPEKAAFRYGLVAVNAAGDAEYSASMSEYDGKISYKLPKDAERLFFVVVGCPKGEYKPYGRNMFRPRGENQEPDPKFDYKLLVK